MSTSADHSHDAVPAGALIGAGVMVVFALCAAATARLLHWHAATAAPVEAVRVLHLRFLDRSDGGVEIDDADHGYAPIEIVPPKTNGFLRGVMRGLARDRHNEHVSEAAPFTLTRWADGEMTLADPQTGRRLSLEVFGPSNSRPFAELLMHDPLPDTRGSTP